MPVLAQQDVAWKAPPSFDSARRTAVRRGYGHAVEPSFVRAELADRAPHSQSPTRTQADESAAALPRR
jgi:hypothetical protein